ncbi:hypothetical protein BDF14DRAFT_1726062 [Spinellus fusiger]|nr:hypothetical protein BDF14DRAFT_1726062 [Spinellus fusiger]
MSHDVSDVKWHSLSGLSDYFMHAMANMNFNGDMKKAHEAADAGAEFTLRHSGALSYQNDTWKVPIRDLVAIYRHIYEASNETSLVPTEDHLQYCMTAGFAAAQLDAKLGHHMFGYYGAKSIQDMAASVTECYTDMIHAFEYGSHSNHSGLCSLYFDSTYTSTKAPRCYYPRRKKDKDVSASGIGCTPLTSYDPIKGILTLSIKNPKDCMALTQQKDSSFSSLNTMPIIKTSTASSPRLLYQNSDVWNLQSKSTWSTTLSLPFSSVAIGHATSVGDFNGDGELDLAISAPYYNGIYHDSSPPLLDSTKQPLMLGAVFVLNDTQTRLQSMSRDPSEGVNDIRTHSQTVLYGNSTQGRFGWSMATIDFNKDGIDDLAVASPFSEDLTGHIDIFFGRAEEGLILSSTPDVRIKVQTMPNTTIEGFGLTLTGMDVDKDGYLDLVVGCPFCSVEGNPQAGAVYVYLGHSLTDPTFMGSNLSPDWTLTSPETMAYGHFGSSIDRIDSVSSQRYAVLLVGAPGYKHKNLQQAGRIYGFKLQGALLPELKYYTTGTKDIAFRKYWQSGVVRLYDARQWMEAAEGTDHVLELKMEHGLVGKLEGRETSGHLGASLIFQEQEGQPSLWIGEPMSEQEKGRVHHWLIKKNTLTCLSNPPALVCTEKHRHNSAFISNVYNATIE